MCSTRDRKAANEEHLGASELARCLRLGCRRAATSDPVDPLIEVNDGTKVSSPRRPPSVRIGPPVRRAAGAPGDGGRSRAPQTGQPDGSCRGRGAPARSGRRIAIPARAAPSGKATAPHPVHAERCPKAHGRGQTDARTTAPDPRRHPSTNPRVIVGSGVGWFSARNRHPPARRPQPSRCGTRS